MTKRAASERDEGRHVTVGGLTPTTTRLGGGRSAWVGALVVLSLLAGLVWVGVSGRPSASPKPVAAEASATPVPSGAAATSTPATIGPAPTPPSELDGETFAVTASIGGQKYPALLEELEPGYLSASFRVPNPPDASEGTLSLDRFWVGSFLDAPVAVGSWRLPLDPIFSNTEREGTVIDVTMPPHPLLLNVPVPVIRGYHLTVSAKNELLFGIVAVEMRIGPNQRIRGDDGIFGWPMVAQLPDLRIKRGVGLFNRCRWDVGPLAGRPGPAHDEASC